MYQTWGTPSPPEPAALPQDPNSGLGPHSKALDLNSTASPVPAPRFPSNIRTSVLTCDPTPGSQGLLPARSFLLLPCSCCSSSPLYIIRSFRLFPAVSPLLLFISECGGPTLFSVFSSGFSGVYLGVLSLCFSVSLLFGLFAHVPTSLGLSATHPPPISLGLSLCPRVFPCGHPLYRPLLWGEEGQAQSAGLVSPGPPPLPCCQA